MAFSTLSFLFVFLPLTAGCYFVIPNRRWRNSVLLAASLVFYSWGEPRYILLMLAASLVAWAGGLAMARLEGAARKAVFAATVALLTANLAVFKYANLLADTACALLGTENPLPVIALPIGISFYTFQILSYVIDLYRREIPPQRNFLTLTLYVSFFPQLIAGPIVRYQTVAGELACRRETLPDAAAGLRRFCVGLGKKVILANSIGALAETVYAGDPAVFGTAAYWLAAVAYALQIFFDFSGYSDMAIGLGRLFGFHFPENFNRPYCAVSITDFWRRWHISLSSWFRDYIYIPLGGSRTSRGKWIRNLLIVWGLTGLWHGASWNFLLWGLYYGLLLLLEKLVLRRVLEKLPPVCGWVYTCFFVLVGWVLFQLTDFGQLAHALGVMFRFAPTDWLGAVASDGQLLLGLVWLPLGVLALLPWNRLRLPLWLRNGLCLALLALCLILILGSSYNPFIYFRF